MQRKPDYRLHADRYTGDMNRMWAVKENLGDPVGQTLKLITNQEASVWVTRWYKTKGKGSSVRPIGSRTAS